MFIAGLFTIAKTKRPHKCSLTDEWMGEDMKYTHMHMHTHICTHWNITQP